MNADLIERAGLNVKNLGANDPCTKMQADVGSKNACEILRMTTALWYNEFWEEFLRQGFSYPATNYNLP